MIANQSYCHKSILSSCLQPIGIAAITGNLKLSRHFRRGFGLAFKG